MAPSLSRQEGVILGQSDDGEAVLMGRSGASLLHLKGGKPDDRAQAASHLVSGEVLAGGQVDVLDVEGDSGLEYLSGFVSYHRGVDECLGAVRREAVEGRRRMVVVCGYEALLRGDTDEGLELFSALSAVAGRAPEGLCLVYLTGRKISSVSDLPGGGLSRGSVLRVLLDEASTGRGAQRGGCRFESAAGRGEGRVFLSSQTEALSLLRMGRTQ